MDLEFLTPPCPPPPPCVPVSLMFTNLDTSFLLRRPLTKEDGGRDGWGGALPSKGTHARKSTPPPHPPNFAPPESTHVSVNVPANPSHHPQPVTTSNSNIPIKLLSFIGIPAFFFKLYRSLSRKPASSTPPPPPHPTPNLPSFFISISFLQVDMCCHFVFCFSVFSIIPRWL